MSKYTVYLGSGKRMAKGCRASQNSVTMKEHLRVLAISLSALRLCEGSTCCSASLYFLCGLMVFKGLQLWNGGIDCFCGLVFQGTSVVADICLETSLIWRLHFYLHESSKASGTAHPAWPSPSLSSQEDNCN